MQTYFAALAVGILVGVIYGLLDVRSPAPPVIALLGLLGILLGEQIVPLAKRALSGQVVSLSVVREESGHHVFGPLPTRKMPATNEDPSTARPPATVG